MKETVHLATWKSAEAEQRFREMEDALLRELVTEAPDASDVPTPLGPTHVYHWRGIGVPVVYLHGSAGTSLMWAPYAERRHGRDMYAVDTMGEVGRSRQDVAIEGAADLAEWLDATLAALGIDRAHLVGTSYGGFLALNLALRRPGRVASLYLIDPAALVRVRMARFMVFGLATLFSSRLPSPLRARAARRLRNPALENPAIMRFALYGQRHHRARLVRPVPLTDDELHSIDVPVRVAVGGRSEVFPAREVIARAELLPNASIEVVPDGGHAVVWSHVDELCADLEAFLAAH